jgi:hypothetical protein
MFKKAYENIRTTAFAVQVFYYGDGIIMTSLAAKYCMHCGYNLNNLSGSRCPECGRDFDPNDDSTYVRRTQRWYRYRGYFDRLLFVGALLSWCLFIAGSWLCRSAGNGRSFSTHAAWKNWIYGGVYLDLIVFFMAFVILVSGRSKSWLLWLALLSSGFPLCACGMVWFFYTVLFPS